MARDLFHQSVKEALVKDGWLVTHDPYRIRDDDFGFNYEVDLGAERVIAAQKNTELIAVEIKSFTKASITYEFHTALGQYMTYLAGLEETEPARQLFLAIPDFIYWQLPKQILFLIERYQLRIIVYEPELNIIIQWKR
ncbi:MAG: element excision factor XisH family protein [Spirosomataceae bacterium]